MSAWREKLVYFMYGRYGNDKLNYALLILWMILAVINIFVGNILFYFITFIPPALVLFRMFSKNTTKRSRENQIYLTYFNKVKIWFKLQVRKIKEWKTHRYFSCPNCKATVRVPHKKGKHTIGCPKCKKDFQKTIRF